MDHVAYFGRGLRRERAYVLRQAPQLLVGQELLIDQVGERRHRRAVQPRAQPPVDVFHRAAAPEPPILAQIGRENWEVGIVLQGRGRWAIAPPLVAVALAAPDGIVHLGSLLQRRFARPAAGWAREFQGYDVLARVREERRKRLDVRHHVAPLGVREPRLPSGHRAPGKPLVDRPQQIRVGWELAARRRADLIQPAGEVARAREHVRRGRAVASPAIAVTARTPLHVDRFAGRRVFGGEKHREREHWSADHFAPPFSVFSHVRGFHPVCSYRNRITDQISRSVRKSSHTGIAEFHGVPSRGSPSPPFATRQNTKLSVSWAIVPLSWKFAGSGLNPTAKCPWPSRWSPWHGRQFW